MKASTEEIQALLDFVLPMTGIVDQKDSTVALTLALNPNFHILLKQRILERLRRSIIDNLSKDFIWSQYNNIVDKKKIGEGYWGFRKTSWPEGAFSCFEINKSTISVGIIFPLKGAIKIQGVEITHRAFRDKLRLASQEALNGWSKIILDRRENATWICWVNWHPIDLVNGGYIEFALDNDAQAKRISACIDSFGAAIELVAGDFYEAV